MSDAFFAHPILNLPYERPARHWELDENRQPTQRIIESRRPADFITLIPKPKAQHGQLKQTEMVLDTTGGLSTADQQYAQTAITIRAVRDQVDRWRQLPESQWRVTPETARLLRWWRSHEFSGIRPFFCQVEAAETAIWLTEVAPQIGREGETILGHLADANRDADPELMRLAMKLATGTGKTTAMAMLICCRRPKTEPFLRGSNLDRRRH